MKKKVISNHKNDNLEFDKWKEGTISLLKNSQFEFLEDLTEDLIKEGNLYVVTDTESKFIEKLSRNLSAWDSKFLKSQPHEAKEFTTEKGPLWYLPWEIKKNKSSLNVPSTFSQGRDLAGLAMNLVKLKLESGKIKIFLKTENIEFYNGFLVGFGLSGYQSRKTFSSSKNKIKVLIHTKGIKKSKEIMESSNHLANGVNLSRHLVNMPGNVLNPKTYTDLVKVIFNKISNVRIDIWDYQKLKKEKMGLMLSVGLGSENQSYLIKISYRPKNFKTSSKVGAFVGKGITFDSGGLDIKPSSAMRLMKKDMGGSASVVGLAYWASQMKLKCGYDFYLAVSENSVSSKSFRPGDIYTSRNGKSVEIHNTDAEGRLVLADALVVASETQPKWIIDVATLTGAIKVGLGSEVAGLFSNDEVLVKKIQDSGIEMGDYCWNMPLYQPYRQQMKSTVADMTNSVDGFGGAITAALFLESFIDKVPWAHLDIYSWCDRPQGVLLEPGGSGQMVQALSHFLLNDLNCPT